MIRKFLLTILLCFSISSYLWSQKIDSKKYINKVQKEYTKQLQLDENQSKKIKQILEEYNAKIQKLIDEKSSNENFNRMVKMSIGDIYSILNREQHAVFFKIKFKVEPLKKYRFNP
jgi:ABC-type transporter MlaC component